MSLLVVGSVAYDAIETPAAKVDQALGGSATFFAAAASYLAPVDLVAVVGTDFDRQELDFLCQQGVDLDGLTVEAGETFRWKGKYLKDMNERETIYTHLNVFEHFNPVLPEKYKNSDFVFLANIGPDLQRSVIEQVARPKFIAMDTMNYWITGTLDSLKQTLARVDALLINDSEVRMLSGENNLFIGARKIQKMGPKTIIIKKGEHGSILIHEQAYFFCPAFPIENLADPTGAGDCFAGGFMGYLALSGKTDISNLRTAVVFGCALASFCVEDFSVNRLMGLSKEEIDLRVSGLHEMTRFDVSSKWMNI
jgi:sugar/nucleoside kinase (ribokinase family)